MAMDLSGDTKSLFEAVPAGVCFVDDEDRVTWSNSMLGDLLGTAPERLSGTTLDDLPFLRIADKTVEPLFASRARPDSRLRIVAKDAGDGNRVVLVTDVTGIVEGVRRLDLEALSKTDPETGLLTTKALFQQLLSEVSRCRRYGNKLGLVMIGLPDNASAGKSAADLVGRLAARLGDNLRWVDHAGRIDEKSFAIILPETDLTATHRVVDKLRPVMNSVIVESGEMLLFGVADWRVEDDASAILGRAKDAMQVNGS